VRGRSLHRPAFRGSGDRMASRYAVLVVLLVGRRGRHPRCSGYYSAKACATVQLRLSLSEIRAEASQLRARLDAELAVDPR
jgi:hypothetical protein